MQVHGATDESASSLLADQDFTTATFRFYAYIDKDFTTSTIKDFTTRDFRVRGDIDEPEEECADVQGAFTQVKEQCRRPKLETLSSGIYGH
jgi:hypothetical protein